MDLNNLIPTDDVIVVEIKHPVTDEHLLKDDGKVANNILQNDSQV
jgi:hypothetical protein